jgi:CheY-like chemotaxis protein
MLSGVRAVSAQWDGTGVDAPADASTTDSGSDLVSSLGTILVVDDEPSVLQVASKVLRRGGYHVIEAQGGDEALQAAATHPGKIDLLLTDVMMPGMSGRKLGEAFTELHPSIAVLFKSAYTQDEVMLHGVRVAEMNFISKPFTVSALREKVRRILSAQS